MLFSRPAIRCLLIITAIAYSSHADTFKNNETGETLTGYATTMKIKDLSVVVTQEKGRQKLDLEKYTIEQNLKGRNDIVVVVGLKDPISYICETETFCQALEKAANRGVSQIIIEVDSPGGYVFLCKRMCNKIKELRKLCPISAFICGGEYNGAYSAAAAVSLSCPKLYMAPNTAIGAATPYVKSKCGELKSDDKFREGFSNYFGNLAKENDKPFLIAKAMVEKDFDVEGFEMDGKKYFRSKTLEIIHPIPEKAKDLGDGKFSYHVPDGTTFYTWSKVGDIVTLSSEDALNTTIADKVIESQPFLIKNLGLMQSKVIIDNSPQKTRKEFEKVEKRVERTLVRVHQRLLNANQIRNRDDAISQLSQMAAELRAIIKLKTKYEDLDDSNCPQIYELYKQVQTALHQL